MFSSSSSIAVAIFAALFLVSEVQSQVAMLCDYINFRALVQAAAVLWLLLIHILGIT
jgi:hypothetical protein